MRLIGLAFALSLTLAPLAAQAQQAAQVYRMGLLGGSSPTSPEAAHVWRDSSRGYGNWGTSRARRSWAPGDRVAEGAYHQFVPV